MGCEIVSTRVAHVKRSLLLCAVPSVVQYNTVHQAQYCTDTMTGMDIFGDAISDDDSLHSFCMDAPTQQQQQRQGAAGPQPTEAKEGEEKGKQPRKAKRKRKARDLRAHLVAKGEPPENLPMG